MNNMRKLMEAIELTNEGEDEADLAIQQIKSILRRKQLNHDNQLVEVTNGKFHGRKGVCYNVQLSSMGEDVYFTYLIYVLRNDGKDVLNGHPDSRRYYAKEDFEWLDGTWEAPQR